MLAKSQTIPTPPPGHINRFYSVNLIQSHVHCTPLSPKYLWDVGFNYKTVKRVCPLTNKIILLFLQKPPRWSIALLARSLPVGIWDNWSSINLHLERSDFLTPLNPETAIVNPIKIMNIVAYCGPKLLPMYMLVSGIGNTPQSQGV